MIIHGFDLNPKFYIFRFRHDDNFLFKHNIFGIRHNTPGFRHNAFLSFYVYFPIFCTGKISMLYL